MSRLLNRTELDETAVANFREYLRIPSVQPNVNYDDCVAFLRKQAESLDLPIKVYEPIANKPIVVMTWTGTEPAARAILLNSHMDVVPVFEDKWTYPPFSAHIDENGDIYARGAQDMKCVAIQYLEAIRRLKANGKTFKRTIHVSFVPDEEIGGFYGMKNFVKTDDFKALNIGFGLDEGCPSPEESFNLFYGEKTTWSFWIRCPGQPGHGSLLLPNNAGEKMRFMIDRLMDIRKEEAEKLENGSVKIGEVLSVNMTQFKGGVQTNVIPEELSAAFDVRLPPTIAPEEFERKLVGWCQEAGDGVTIEYIQKNPTIESTKLDNNNPFWIAFEQIFDKMGLNLEPQILSGATDIRFLRELGIPAINFSPMNNTPSRPHDHNEFLNKDIFLRGIEIYMNLITALANV